MVEVSKVTTVKIIYLMSVGSRSV